MHIWDHRGSLLIALAWTIATLRKPSLTLYNVMCHVFPMNMCMNVAKSRDIMSHYLWSTPRYISDIPTFSLGRHSFSFPYSRIACSSPEIMLQYNNYEPFIKRYLIFSLPFYPRNPTVGSMYCSCSL